MRCPNGCWAVGSHSCPIEGWTKGIRQKLAAKYSGNVFNCLWWTKDFLPLHKFFLSIFMDFDGMSTKSLRLASHLKLASILIFIPYDISRGPDTTRQWILFRLCISKSFVLQINGKTRQTKIFLMNVVDWLIDDWYVVTKKRKRLAMTLNCRDVAEYLPLQNRAGIGFLLHRPPWTGKSGEEGWNKKPENKDFFYSENKNSLLHLQP